MRGLPSYITSLTPEVSGQILIHLPISIMYGKLKKLCGI